MLVIVHKVHAHQARLLASTEAGREQLRKLWLSGARVLEKFEELAAAGLVLEEYEADLDRIRRNSRVIVHALRVAYRLA